MATASRTRMTLKMQLILALTMVGLIPFLIMGISSYMTSSESLETAAVDKLTMARDNKKHELQTYVNLIDGAMQMLGKSGDVNNMVNELVRWHNEYNVQANGAFDITGKSEVQMVYSKYHEYFKDFIDKYKLYDLFIICKPHGHVMYSVAKKSDLGENLGSGKLRDSALAKAWRMAVSKNQTVFIDMEPYAPSNGAPAMFMATPIIDDNGNTKGIVAVQVGMEVINAIMTNRAGLGETGETYLVGSDYLMRSDSYLDPTHHTVDASFKNPTLGSVKTEAAELAFKGESATRIITDYSGNPALSSFTLIDFFGVQWALLAEQEESEVFAAVNDLRNTAIIMGLVFTVLILGIALLLGNFVSKPIIRAVEQIRDGSAQIVTASNQIASSSQALAEGSTTQASSVEEVSATVEEATSINTQNAEYTQEANNLAKDSTESAEVGNAKIQNLMQSMEEITEASQQIAKIIKTIDEIAFQTNLLALNAAVEAARAGEHGLGFAVVADEVKNLAQRSATAAKETAGIIERAIELIKNGNEISTSANVAFSEITTKVSKTSQIIGEINVSIREQSDGMNQIASAMGQIDQVTQTNAATSEQAAAAAEELNAQSVMMMNSVADIAKLVGLDTNMDAMKMHHDTHTTSRHASTSYPEKPAPKITQKTKKPRNSEDVFPLDSDDLKEF